MGLMACQFFINRSSRAEGDDFRTSLIGTINDPIPAYSETPVAFQLSFKRFPAVWVYQDLIERGPHFTFHLRVQMADKLSNCFRNLEGSLGHPGLYSSKSSSTV